MKVFGKRDERLHYCRREAVYAIIQRDEHFLCVEDEDGHLFLVGGGIEAGETAEQALYREGLEETGHRLAIQQVVGHAERHWVSAKYPNDSQHNVCVVYACELLEKVTEPIEAEVMRWVTLEQLEASLFHAHHLYLVKQFLHRA